VFVTGEKMLPTEGLSQSIADAPQSALRRLCPPDRTTVPERRNGERPLTDTWRHFAPRPTSP
jgi:hypothetical protein